MPHPRYSSGDIVRRGQALYEEKIRAEVEAQNKGKVLVIDIETGQYEIDDDQMAASERALAKHPEAALYAMRIGHPALTYMRLRPTVKRG